MWGRKLCGMPGVEIIWKSYQKKHIGRLQWFGKIEPKQELPGEWGKQALSC